jgi:phytoene dehydrogenase-like protein
VADERDALIIGGGHNALVAAFYLAKAGMKPLLLERAPMVGGCAVTEEFAPGFRCSTLSHSAGPIWPQVWRDMALERRGVHMIESDPRLFAPLPDGRALFLFADPAKSAAEIVRFSKHDAAQYPEFHGALARIGAVASQLLASPPPEIDEPKMSDMLGLLKTGRGIRSLGKKDLYRLIRWAPMAVADLVQEFFESEPLRAALAARGIFGCAMGPWSAGTGAVLLLRAATDPNPAQSVAFVRGGLGALTQAMAAAAQEAGAQIRTGAEVARIEVKGGEVSGVTLKSGETLAGEFVVSGADPRRTLLTLLDPLNLNPDFVQRLANYRSGGTLAKMNLALDAVPSFAALSESNGAAGITSGAALAGRMHIGPEIDYLERAFDASKYGGFSQHPYLEVTIPSLTDPSLAPAGKHVMSIYAQFAPYHLRNGGGPPSSANWNAQRDALADSIVKTLAAYAPDLPSKILHRQMLTPLDLEQKYGLTGGHIFHGELSLDQLFTMRPLLDWARYHTPIEGLYLCGSGTHPGTGLNGLSGWNAARAILKDLRS